MGETSPTYLNPQALLVAGGKNGHPDDNSNFLSSVLTLLPQAETWAPLTPLPRVLYGAKASIVEGLLRVSGGWDEVSAHPTTT